MASTPTPDTRTRPLDPVAALNRANANSVKWKRRRDIPLAILAWIGVIAVVLWCASHVIRSLLLLIIAALLAFALAPAVRLLQRVMPRLLAILIVYIIVLGAVSFFVYLVVSSATHQVISLSQNIRQLLTPSGTGGQPTPLEQTLISFGITQAQIDEARHQVVTYAEGFAVSAFPFLRGIFDFVLDTLVIAILSIYFLLDGGRITRWLRTNMPDPQQARVHFFLDTLERVVGGYIRGQITLALLIGILVGVGMFVIHVPYAVLLGVLAFILAFVPVIGTFISGAACVLLALTLGWPWAVGVLVYFVLIHIFEADLVGPRIVGKAIGIHPIVSLTALIAGAELFGILGALFAAPLAGVVQALLVAFWKEWRDTHPRQFQQKKEDVDEEITQNLADHPVG